MVILIPSRNFGKIGAEKVAKNGQKEHFWAKNSYFWPFCYVSQHQLAKSGEI